MSNKELSKTNNLSESDINISQSYHYKEDNTSQDFLDEITEKLCDLYIEEERKGNLAPSILGYCYISLATRTIPNM
ncbi:20983_t:CDS:2, partial [Cetraspora pellucida]